MHRIQSATGINFRLGSCDGLVGGLPGHQPVVHLQTDENRSPVSILGQNDRAAVEVALDLRVVVPQVGYRPNLRSEHLDSLSFVQYNRIIS